jgi:uncharacterized membrane protein YqaE (UPF0057 family)
MDNKVLQVIVSLFIPPLAVYMKKNTGSGELSELK